MQRADKYPAPVAEFGSCQFLRKPQISRPPAIGASLSRYIEWTKMPDLPSKLTGIIWPHSVKSPKPVVFGRRMN
jgi:hypothetical protein